MAGVKRGCYVIIERNGLYAAMRSNKYSDGRLGFLGGKVQPNETHKDAAIRECWEEAHVLVKNLIQFRQSNVHDPNDPSITYDGVGFRGEIDTSAELIGGPEGEVFWRTREEIIAKKAFPDLEEVFKEYDASIINETLERLGLQ